MRIRLLLVAAPLMAALAACGSPGEATDDGIAAVSTGTAKPSASASALSPEDRQEAALKFAQCMREHGVDMADPGPDGGIRITSRGGEGDQAKTQEALKECQHLMQGAVGNGNGPVDQKRRDQMIKYAQCMREHGVDMPDPGENGTIQLRAPKGSEEKVKKAQEACKDLAPGGLGGQQQ